MTSGWLSKVLKTGKRLEEAKDLFEPMATGALQSWINKHWKSESLDWMQHLAENGKYVLTVVDSSNSFNDDCTRNVVKRNASGGNTAYFFDIRGAKCGHAMGFRVGTEHYVFFDPNDGQYSSKDRDDFSSFVNQHIQKYVNAAKPDEACNVSWGLWQATKAPE
jgi:hypothetical protein